MTQWKPCPDFDLAPLSEFDPKVFNWDTTDKDLKDLYAFIVTLALIYNDFKDSAWWQKQLDECPPKSDEVSPYFGQHNGMKTHISRLVVGLYTELLKMIKENKKVLELKAFKEILGAISARYRRDWQKLVSESSNEKLIRDLDDLRANVVYHYYNIRGIFNGYMNYFKNGKDPANKKAYFSSGEKILTTRFYFADAAVRGYAFKFSEKEINYLLDEMNTSLKSIVEAGIDYHCVKYSASS